MSHSRTSLRKTGELRNGVLNNEHASSHIAPRRRCESSDFHIGILEIFVTQSFRIPRGIVFVLLRAVRASGGARLFRVNKPVRDATELFFYVARGNCLLLVCPRVESGLRSLPSLVPRERGGNAFVNAKHE